MLRGIVNKLRIVVETIYVIILAACYFVIQLGIMLYVLLFKDEKNN